MTHLYLGPLYHGPPYNGPHPWLTCTMTHRTMVYIHDSAVPWSTGQWPISIYNWPAMTCIHKLLITYLIYINRRSARARKIEGIHTENQRDWRYILHYSVDCTSTTECLIVWWILRYNKLYDCRVVCRSYNSLRRATLHEATLWQLQVVL